MMSNDEQIKNRCPLHQILVGALPGDEVFKAALAGSEGREAVLRFAGAQGEALSVEGWVEGAGLSAFRFSSDVHRARRATVTVLRASPGADLELRGGGAGADASPLAAVAAQVQIVTCGAAVPRKSSGVDAVGGAGGGIAVGGIAAGGGLGDVYRGLQRVTQGWVLPLAADCADYAAGLAGAEDDDPDGAGPKAAHAAAAGADSDDATPQLSQADVKLAREVVRKAADLRGALENLHKQAAIPMLRLEVHELLAASVKAHGLADGADGSPGQASSSAEVDIDALCLGPKTLALPPGAAGSSLELPEYTTFLNDLQRLVTSSWKKEVAKLAGMTREPFRSTVAEELAFWRELHDALSKGQKQFESFAARATLQVLRLSNRNIGMNLKDMEATLKRALAHSADALDFLREFPIEALDGAPGLQALLAAVDAVFAVVQRKVRNSEHAYKLERVVAFVGAVERAVAARAVQLLDGAAAGDSGAGSSSSLVSSSLSFLSSSSSSSSSSLSLASSGGFDTRLMALPFKDFKAKVAEFHAVYRRWLEGFFGPAHPTTKDALHELSKALTGTGSGSGFGAQGSSQTDRPPVGAVALARQGSDGPAVPLEEFLKEQSTVPGRMLLDGKEQAASMGKRAMHELLEGFKDYKVRSALFLTAARLVALEKFRTDHEELCRSLADESVAQDLAGSELSSVEDAYGAFAREASVLASLDADEALNRHLATYDRAVHRVEASVTAVLTKKLEATSGADEMFGVFRRYNRLFNRKRIKPAVVRYQVDILRNVQGAVSALREKMLRGYEGSDAHRLATLRDVPPVAGHIIWAIKIKDQLDHLEAQLESVIGTDWAEKAGSEGTKLKGEVAHLQRNLNPHGKFDAWVDRCRVAAREQSAQDLVLVLREDPFARAALDQAAEKAKKAAAGTPAHAAALQQLAAAQRAAALGALGGALGSRSPLTLEVNFDAHALEVLKEVRNLAWLGSAFQVPSTIRGQAREAEVRYPTAVALKGALRTFAVTKARVPPHQLVLFERPIRAFQLDVRQALDRVRRPVEKARAGSGKGVERDCAQVTWGTQQQDPTAFSGWVTGLTDHVFALEQAVEDLEMRTRQVEALLAQLEGCPFGAQPLGEQVRGLQHVVDAMGQGDMYSNLDKWVAALNGRIEAILVARLTAAVRGWVADFGRDRNQSLGKGGRGGGGGEGGGTKKATPLVLAAAAAFMNTGNNAKAKRRASLVWNGDKENGPPAAALAASAAATTADGDSTDDKGPVEPMELEATTHEVLHANRQMFLQPPLDEARVHWMGAFQANVVASVAGLPRLVVQDLSMGARGGQRGSDGGRGSRLEFGDRCVAKVPAAVMASVWRAIEGQLGQVKGYVEGWLQYQALWDLQAKSVVRRFTWEARAAALEHFKSIENHVRVHPSHETDDGVRLGAWCLVQARARPLGLLSGDQVKRLDALGFDWAHEHPAVAAQHDLHRAGALHRGGPGAGGSGVQAATAAFLRKAHADKAGDPAVARADQAAATALAALTSEGGGGGEGGSGAGDPSADDDGLGGIGTKGLALWVQLLADIKASRATIDTSGSSKSFGAVVVDYSQVQAKVTDRYDSWQKALQDEFGKVLFAAIGQCHGRLSLAKARLEKANLRTCDQSEVIDNVTFIQDMMQKRGKLQELVEKLKEAEQQLSRQRSPSFVFRPDWVYASNLEGVYQQFFQILSKNSEVMKGQLSDVKKRVRSEDEALGQKLVVLERRWRVDVPEWGAVVTGEVFAGGPSGLAQAWQALFDFACARHGVGGGQVQEGDDGDRVLGRAGVRAALGDAELDARLVDVLELPPELAGAAHGDGEDAAHARLERALADLDRNSVTGGDWVTSREFAALLLKKRQQTSPTDALANLKAYGDQIDALSTEHRKLRYAKDKLDIKGPTPLPGGGGGSGGSGGLDAEDLDDFSTPSRGGGGPRDAERVLSDLSKDVAYQEQVWGFLKGPVDRLAALHATKWSDREAEPKRVRRDLEAVEKELVAGHKSHAAFESVMAHVSQRKRCVLLLADLRSDAVKPRHLAEVLGKVGRGMTSGIDGTFSTAKSSGGGGDKQQLVTRAKLRDLVLGDFVPRRLELHKRAIGDVVAKAQGEMALEEFLRKTEEGWGAYELELVHYQSSGVMLLKGWDNLFGKLEDDLAALAAMKQSPYFNNVRKFEEQAASWEAMLTRMTQTFDLWIDVQRRWVYLGGIFFGGTDIKAQLPAEHARFEAVDREFVDLMKKVRKRPLALEAACAGNPEEHAKRVRQLEKHSDLMGQIQKALGEYLERQRAAFSRFYFVGDEDLLEIVGNSKEARKVVVHLGKMFAAIAGVQFSGSDGDVAAATATSSNYLAAMLSKEGEVVPLHAPELCGADALKGKEAPGVKEWLAGLEANMMKTLALLVADAVASAAALPPVSDGAAFGSAFDAWLSPLPAQVAVLAIQVAWARSLEAALGGGGAAAAQASLDAKLVVMAKNVLVPDVVPAQRRKYEQLITELVHQRNVTRVLHATGVAAADDFGWLVHLRLYNSGSKGELECRMADTAFDYGFEYQGVGERLVQTPLTDRCYLTLTQALHLRMGGNPFGPAGTGKTESVKALGNQLGRFVLVFNCDEAFDFAAMGRIFAGLCQVGAWGCFDEFNRLEERILSAVSQQILTIQRGLQELRTEVNLLGRPVRLSPRVGIFVTMNPGYAGRSELPDNLKALFRAVAMSVPNFKLIAQVMLFSQGIVAAEELAEKVVLLFQMCDEQLSKQPHYDFGLRALKSVLVGAGDLKRNALAKRAGAGGSSGGDGDADGATLGRVEREVLIRSTDNTVLPKLVADDLPLYTSLLAAVFPDRSGQHSALGDDDAAATLHRNLKAACRRHGLVAAKCWVDKVMQLWMVTSMRRGVMLVGPTGSGKSTSWRCLLSALEACDGVKGECHVIDPKAIDKDILYGTLDPTTLEWTDGVFTAILRNVLTNHRGDKERRHWVVFDGDVDPDWAENLNSVLDDNGLLTLPSGERLRIPDNMRIFMEVDTLKHTTMATVSRCGMVWYSEACVTHSMALAHQLNCLASGVSSAAAFGGEFVSGGAAWAAGVGAGGVGSGAGGDGGGAGADAASAVAGGDGEVPEARREFVEILRPLFLGASADDKSGGDDDNDDDDDDDDEGGGGGFDATAVVPAALAWALSPACVHVMEASRERLLGALCVLLRRGLDLVLEYNDRRPDFPMRGAHLRGFVERWAVHALVWGLGGACAWASRNALAELVCDHPRLSGSLGSGLASGASAVDMRVRVEDGEWEPWAASVPTREVEARQVTGSDVVVPTTDTLRHEEAIRACLAAHRPLVLCGPPGSGKTMTLTSVLSAMPELVLVPLNFSSTTTPELLLKTFAQYCETVKTPKGLVMQPLPSLGTDKWLVVFCDEVNLAAEDKYGTVRVVSLMRQLAEQQGFFRPQPGGAAVWVSLKRVQFVGACNPPTDAGRVPMSPRFLRHAPLVLVDYPPPASLKQIYGAFVKATLKVHGSDLLAYAGPLTDAMIDFYDRNRVRFTAEMAPQYVYSPRELSRWVRALFEAVEPLDCAPTPDELVRLWAHEGLRLFHDRLMDDSERAWCEAAVDAVAERHFHGLSTEVAVVLQRPLLYSKWLGRHYGPVGRDDLRGYMQARLRAFYEEELDVDLVMFDTVLDHVLRLDSVLRNPMGHLLLVGESGTGKTVLTKFVSWINGLSVFTIKASRKYTLLNFDEDLREVMRRAGVEGEKICFLFDEANALSSAFLEKMNALLASGEVPGLFEGDDRAALMTGCREAAAKGARTMVDSDDELFRMFTRAVQRNLHVVFTMNPAGGEWKHRCTASPALFNRCVVDWFGTWSDGSLAQVAAAFTDHLDMGESSGRPYQAPKGSGTLLAVADPAFRLQSGGGDESDDDADVGGSRGGGFGGISLRQAVVAALVHVHGSVRTASDLAGKRTASRHWASPRDFLDLIRKVVGIVKEKRAELEEQQRHLRGGLDRLLETQESVAELQGSLAVTEAKLKEKNTAANEKLTLMLDKQGEAEKEKEKQAKLSVDLEQRDTMIAARSAEVKAELDEAEPALASAKEAVSGIKKTQLDEVRALRNPPKLVQLTMEACCFMLGHKDVDNWDEVRKVIRKEEFIHDILEFDSSKLAKSMVASIKSKYMSDPNTTAESVHRASKACGPLFQWALSQVDYCTVVARVEPLRDEVDHLRAQSEGLRTAKARADEAVGALAQDIERYKQEYAAAIRDIDAIKVELDKVKTKVARAETLLRSLSAEQGRWEDTEKTFGSAERTLVGDGLLAGAFATYAGIFDHRTRRSLREEWRQLLEDLGVPHRPDLAESLVEYLSKASVRLAWQGLGLPNDDLCMENAIALERFHRFPLVVDPSGQATRFLLNKYADRRIAQTSFLDASFMKVLASAIRFGTPLMVHDVENVDPVLNPVLNRELQKTGGRTLIRLGGEDIDYSPKFLVLLVTRNPAAQFAPDLCSRVTLVNFTVTPASLEAQALGTILKAERPDVERRRVDVLRQQGEQNVRLRGLEDALLATLAAVQGNILDDDSVVQALERLKREAAEVNADMARSDAVLAEVKAVADGYAPLASACAGVYFVLEQLASLKPLYQFTIQFFLSLLAHVLAPPLPGDGDHQEATASAGSSGGKAGSKAGPSGDKERLARLRGRFFRLAALRVSRGLLWEDKLTFAVRLAQIKHRCEAHSAGGDAAARGSGPSEEEMDALLRAAAASTGAAAEGASPRGSSGGGRGLDEAQARAAAALSGGLAACKGLAPALGVGKVGGGGEEEAAAWAACLASSEPEGAVPRGWMAAADRCDAARAAFLELLAVKALRPDRLVPALERYVAASFGGHFPWRGLTSGGSPLADLQHLVEDELNPTAYSGGGGGDRDPGAAAAAAAVAVSGGSVTPVLLCAAGAGRDASGRVEALAALRKVPLHAMSMGSSEGLADAEKLVRKHAKAGNAWVLLRNVHLVPSWLEALEKKLHALAASPTFRLFLTADVSPKLPTSLLRSAVVVVSDAPTGVKASLQALLRSVPLARLQGGCHERRHLYLLLAWFHATVMERLRYAPLGGFAKPHEFSSADAECGLAVVDAWCARAAGSRSHVDPDKEIPWQAVRAVLAESTYGGRVDGAFDQRVLQSFLASTFTASAFQPGFRPGSPGAPLFPPPGSAEALLAWVEALPESNPPTWVGLTAAHEAKLMAHTGQRLLRKVAQLQEGGLDDDVAGAAGGEAASAGGDASGGGGAKLAALRDKVKAWAEALAQHEAPLAAAADAMAVASALASTAGSASTGGKGGGGGNDGGSSGGSSAALTRCVHREVAKGSALLRTVLGDLREVLSFCGGTARPTNPLRALVGDLGRGVTPPSWRKAFTCAASCAASAESWLLDFGRRAAHCRTLAGPFAPAVPGDAGGTAVGGAGGGSAPPLHQAEFWLGGLFNPEAFITASRQHTAQATGRALDELAPHVLLGGDEPGRGDKVVAASAQGFVLRGLTLEGAGWDAAKRELTAPGGGEGGGGGAVSRARFVWAPKAEVAGGPTVEIPLYLNDGRAVLLATVDLPRGADAAPDVLCQFGAALVAWTP